MRDVTIPFNLWQFCKLGEVVVCINSLTKKFAASFILKELVKAWNVFEIKSNILYQADLPKCLYIHAYLKYL